MNHYWTIAIAGSIAGGFIAVAAFSAFLLIRSAIRRVCGNHDDTLSNTRPRVRTRIQHSPIETDIAKTLAREFPGRNPATFIEVRKHGV